MYLCAQVPGRRQDDLSSGEILIYGETLRSNVQRKDDSGTWVRLLAWPVVEGEPIPFSDWFTFCRQGLNMKPRLATNRLKT